HETSLALTKDTHIAQMARSDRKNDWAIARERDKQGQAVQSRPLGELKVTLRFFRLPKTSVQQTELVVDGSRVRHVLRGLFKSYSGFFQLASRQQHLAQLEHQLAVAWVDTLRLTEFALRSFVVAILSVHDA